MGNVTLELQRWTVVPGGQICRNREEIYFVVEGTGRDVCLGEGERCTVTLWLVKPSTSPPASFINLTNVGDTPLRMIYCYGPAGMTSRTGVRNSITVRCRARALKRRRFHKGAHPQCTDKPK